MRSSGPNCTALHSMLKHWQKKHGEWVQEHFLAKYMVHDEEKKYMATVLSRKRRTGGAVTTAAKLI